MDELDKKTHTVFPLRYMVVTGSVEVGFKFYGMFFTRTYAQNWADENLKPGVVGNIHSIRKVLEG